ncbi:MAG: rod shape-determining protein RodA [Patescibacteria group bacterium]
MILDQYFSHLKKNDWALLAAVFLLIAFGLSAIYSVALGQGLGEFINFKKQLVWLVVGVFLMFFISSVNYHYWRRWAWLGYFLGLILLVLVLTPLGSTIRGSQGWFSLGIFSFQPVEFMKIFLIIVLADVYSRYARTINKFLQLVLIGLLVVLPLGLVMLQPDFGSAMVIFFVWLLSSLLLIRKKWHLAVIIILILASFLVSWNFVFQDYQKDRIITFVNPAADPLGSGYNVRQSIIAVGAGRLLGRGLGFGSQSQLKFIPESQTDFIFAVIAEELGLVGVLLVLVFFFLIFYRVYLVATRAPDDFGMFLALLILIVIFVHVFINIGMGLGLMPVTGISLPLVSYGGSFLIVTLFFIGLVLNIYKSALVFRR